jgi:AraC-like DNA-binding protein
MFASPLRPSTEAFSEVGWHIREWHTGHGTSLCLTEVDAEAHWQGHFEDLVLTQCLRPVRARFDFGESRALHPMSEGEFLLLPAKAPLDVGIRQRHVSLHCALPLALITAHESGGLSLGNLRVLFDKPFRSPWISMLTNDLWAEARDGLPRGRLFGEAAASLLAFALARAAGERPAIHKGGLSPRQFRDAQERIDASLATGITLQELASEAGLSIWHFSRAFHASASEPLVEYINRRRIAKAQTCLAKGGVSVLQAASESGFSSPSHFAKLFRRYTGLSPREWLRAQR